MSRSLLQFISISLLLVVSLSSAQATISEAEFNQLIDQVAGEYKPIFQKNGDRLSVSKFWSSKVINAHAKRMDNEVGLNFHGGLARLPAMNQGMFVLVICHELGHLLGGAPYSTPKDFMSAEGQADYFASAKCFRHMLRIHPDYLSFFNLDSIPEDLKNECSFVQNDDEKFKICLASGLASRDLINTLARLSDTQFPGVEFSTKDSTVVKKTLTSYPSAQCRLDTLMAGSLCSIDADQLPSKDNGHQGICNLSAGHYSFEVRPACWYLENP